MFDFFKKKDENKPQEQKAAQEQSEKKAFSSLTFESLKKTIEKHITIACRQCCKTNRKRRRI